MALNVANNNSLSAITTKPSGLSGGALNLISTQTASASASISFTSGIDSTYDSYVFKFIDMHPDEADASELKFQVSTDGGSSYGVNITSSSFTALNYENGTAGALTYVASTDLAQSTDFNHISQNHIGFDDDQCFAGALTLYNPSSTTFAKHFIIYGNSTRNDDRTYNNFHAGYVNTTSAINAIKFAMMDGQTLKNMNGIIKMYGVS